MKVKYILIWFLLQLIAVFIIAGLFVNGKPNLGSQIFTYFTVQFFLFLLIVIYKFILKKT